MARKRSRRNTTARKRSSSGAKRSVENAARGRAASEEKARIRLEIIAIALIAIGAFLIFALFSDASGTVGAGLSNGLSGLFGLMAGALPFFLIAYGVLLVIGLIRGADLRRSILIAAVYILFCILLAGRYIDTINGDAVIAGSDTVAQVFAGSAAGNGGGVVGAYIAKGLVSLIGKAGLYILCIALVCISGILLAGMSMAMATRVVREKTLSAREERQKRLDERRVLYNEGRVDIDYDGENSRAGGDGQGSFRLPSFLGGGNGEKGVDKHKNIIDAVKNDDVYGDHTKPRGLEIEDTDHIEPDEPKRDDKRPLTSDSSLGKRTSAAMQFGSGQDDSNYKLPGVNLLPVRKSGAKKASPTEQRANAARLEQALRDFGVEARVRKVTIGPTVTRYEVEPDIGVKIQSIRSLDSDLALKLEVESVRVVPIAGESVIGIEANNASRGLVSLREIVDSDEFRDANSKLSIALGKNLAGKRIVVDLAVMPHLLIAGMTGAGKSVCINSILLSILYKAKPSEVKFILIDPKVVELAMYNDLPHLLVPVVDDIDRAATALIYAVKNMEDRYKTFKENRVNDLESYNEKMIKEGRQDEMIPQIVIVIDELADLMMQARDKVEMPICRIAQKGRAAGLHLIVATQQPIVKYVTGIIKANIPARIAFKVTSNMSSRVILDTQGAELLTGEGDMLFAPNGPERLIRAQGALTKLEDVVKIVNYINKQMDPDYSAEIVTQMNAPVAAGMTDEDDEFFFEAVEMLAMSKTVPKQVSVSMLQRRFRIGYNRAARLVDMMEERGIVSPTDGTNKPRRLVMSEAELAGFLALAGQDGYDYEPAEEDPDDPFENGFKDEQLFFDDIDDRDEDRDEDEW